MALAAKAVAKQHDAESENEYDSLQCAFHNGFSLRSAFPKFRAVRGAALTALLAAHLESFAEQNATCLMCSCAQNPPLACAHRMLISSFKVGRLASEFYAR